MKVIVFGEQDAFCSCMFSWLASQKHEIYSVCETKPSVKNKDVFQQYIFPYNAESIFFIMENVRPDIVIAMGAKDQKYIDVKKEMLGGILSGDLSNILTASQTIKPELTIVLSTLDAEADAGNNTEEISPSITRTQAIWNMEALCKSYRNTGLKICLVELGELYGRYKEQRMHRGILEQLAVSYSNSMACRVDYEKLRNMVHIQDAAKALLELIDGHIGESVYQLYGEELTTEQVVAIWNSYDGAYTETIDEISARQERPTLHEQPQIIVVERKYQLKDYVPEHCRYAHKEKKIVAKKKRNMKAVHTIWRKLRPLLDNALLFVVVVAVQFLVKNITALAALDLFLWYTLLIASVYNLRQGSIAVGLSIVGKVALLSYTGALFQALENFSFYFWVMQLVVIMLVVSFAKQKYQESSRTAISQYEAQKQAYIELKEINNATTAIKQEYEKRLVNYQDSPANLYQTIQALDYANPLKVIFEAGKMIKKIADSGEISFYLQSSSSGGYETLLASSAQCHMDGLKILNKPENDVLREIMDEELFYNRTVREGYPSVAAGVYLGKELHIAVMLWSLPLAFLNQYDGNKLLFLLRIMGDSLQRAYRHIAVRKPAIYVYGSRVMCKVAFDEILAICEEAAQNSIFSFVLLRVKMQGEHALSCQKLGRLLREIDYAGEDSEGEFRIIISQPQLHDLTRAANWLEQEGAVVKEVYSSQAA